MKSEQPILVTGAAGFIGSHLVDRLLSDGRRVVGLDNFCDFYDPGIKRSNIESALGQPGFELIEGDIRDREGVTRVFAAHEPGVVFHLAAMAGVRPSIERPDLYTQVNLDGTVNLLDAAVLHKTPGFVFASSSSVYGNCPTAPFSEDARVDNPISPYAATKKAGELIAHTYWHLHQLPVVCVRFFTVYGPRQRPDLAINKFLRLVLEGKPIPMYGDGTTSRDYTFISDIVGGLLAAMERSNPAPGQGFGIYNLGSDQPVSLTQLIETVEQVTGSQVEITKQPMQPGDVNRTWADLTRSKADLGYQAKVGLRDGIEQQWRWLQQALKPA